MSPGPLKIFHREVQVSYFVNLSGRPETVRFVAFDL